MAVVGIVEQFMHVIFPPSRTKRLHLISETLVPWFNYLPHVDFDAITASSSFFHIVFSSIL